MGKGERVASLFTIHYSPFTIPHSLLASSHSAGEVCGTRAAGVVVTR
jgi:hypothetical protein